MNRTIEFIGSLNICSYCDLIGVIQQHSSKLCCVNHSVSNGNPYINGQAKAIIQLFVPKPIEDYNFRNNRSSRNINFIVSMKNYNGIRDILRSNEIAKEPISPTCISTLKSYNFCGKHIILLRVKLLIVISFCFQAYLRLL